MAPARHRLLLEILAGCGLRISEALALQRLHFQLDDGQPRGLYPHGIRERADRAAEDEAGRREVRLSASLAAKVRASLDANPGQPHPTCLQVQGGGSSMPTTFGRGC